MADNASTVLLLEDEPLIAMDIELALKAEGFDVSSAMSCFEASLWLNQYRPDIVVVDIELQDGTCTDVAIRLLKNDIPFIVYSGDRQSFHVDTPFAQGTWIGKPAPPEDIVHALKVALAGRTLAKLSGNA